MRADTGYAADHACDAINMLMTAHGAGSFGDGQVGQRQAFVGMPVGEVVPPVALGAAGDDFRRAGTPVRAFTGPRPAGSRRRR